MIEYDFSRMKLSLPARLALAAGLFAVGAALQAFFHWGLVPGVIAIFVGYVPLHLKPATNKPSDQGLEEWRPVGMAEVDRLADTLRESKKLRGLTMGSTALMVAISIVALAVAAAASIASPNLSLAIADGWLFAVPAMFFGRVKVYVPADLSLKMPCFQAVFSEKVPSGFVLTPYLRFDKDADGRDVPEDIRFMVEPARKPADFVGVQVQSAINKGPNGNVPYMYSVVLTKGKGESFRKLRGLRVRGYEVEPGGDDEYGTIVVRQDTSNGGYYTKPSDCVRLYEVALEVLASNFKS
jgi:hypothetical protein